MAKNWVKFSAAKDTIAFLARNRRALLIYGAIIAFLVALPLLEPVTEALSSLFRTNIILLLFLIFLFTILAQSWNIIGGYAGQISLAHAAFFGLGAMTTRFLWLFGLPFPVALLAGGVAAVPAALIIGFPAFRLRGIYFILGTLAFAEVARIVVTNVLPELTYLKGEYAIAYELASRYYLVLALAIVVVAVVYIMSKSRLGMGMMAVREDEDTAEASGVSTLKYKLLAFAISAFFAGLAGAAFAFYHPAYNHYYPFSPLWTFDAVIIAFIGGLGTTTGPILGALFYVVLREIFVVTLPGEFHILVFGALFILVVLFLPGGLVELLGKARRFWARL